MHISNVDQAANVLECHFSSTRKPTGERSSKSGREIA